MTLMSDFEDTWQMIGKAFEDSFGPDLSKVDIITVKFNGVDDKISCHINIKMLPLADEIEINFTKVEEDGSAGT